MKNSQFKSAKSRYRRLSRDDFSIVMSQGVRANIKHFSIVYKKDLSGHAVVVSKKVAKKAVIRHRIKRRVRAVLREICVSEGCIIFARTGADVLDYKKIYSEIQELITHVK